MHAIYSFSFGFIRIEYQNERLTGLICSPENPTDQIQTSEKNMFTDDVFAQVQEYLQGKRQTFHITYQLSGTDFQQKVWQALLQIPYGETRTYKEIARSIGNENASRAVGAANHKNKLHLIVPCHRVIGTDGKLVGYAGGLKLKEYLLHLEKTALENKGVLYVKENCNHSRYFLLWKMLSNGCSTAYLCNGR